MPNLEEREYTDGIRGKVLDKVRINNMAECRYIALQFQDNTEVTIYLDIRMTGRLTLSDWSTDNEKVLKTLGQFGERG